MPLRYGGIVPNTIRCNGVEVNKITYNGIEIWTSKIFLSDYQYKLRDIYSLSGEYKTMTRFVAREHKYDTSKLTTMESFFWCCDAIEYIDITGWNTANVTSTYDMCRSCEKLQTINMSGLDTRNIKSMECMFDRCKSLTTVDMTGCDTSNVKSFYCMFNGCENLTQIKGVLDLRSASGTFPFNHMFDNCSKLTGVQIRNPPADFAKYSGLQSHQYTIVS